MTTLINAQIIEPSNTKNSFSLEEGILRINRTFYTIIGEISDMINGTIEESTAEFHRREAYTLLYGNSFQGQGVWYGSPDNHLLDMASDDAVKGTDAGDQPEMSFVEQYDWNSSNRIMYGKWEKAEWALEHIENSVRILNHDPTQLDYNKLIAELLFLKAYFNFENKRVFNEGSWNEIENDYLSAINNLPIEHSGEWPKGRPIVLMAQAMLGKVYIYQGKWSDALTQFETVINSGKYSLISEYKNLWPTVYESSNIESIWSINYTPEIGDQLNSHIGASIDTSSKPRGLNHPYISPWGCCGFFQATQDLVDAFQTSDGLPLLDDSWKMNHITNPTGDQNSSVGEPIGDPEVDPRLDFSVGRPGILFNNHHIMQVDYVRDVTYAGPYFNKKHIGEPEDFGLSGWGNITGVDYHMMRYADLLLLTAEAYVELGQLENARTIVNQIRQRAISSTPVPEAIQGAVRREYTITNNPAANYNISLYESSWTSQTYARKAVRYERRLELAHEGHRLFDLWRWGNASEVLNDFISRESKYRTYLDGKSYNQNNYYPKPIQ